MSIFSRHCFQFKFSILGRLSLYGFLNITFTTISSTYRALLPHNIQNCNSNYFLKCNKLTFKYIFRCGFKTYTATTLKQQPKCKCKIFHCKSEKLMSERPPASAPDERASHILTCFAKLMDSLRKKKEKTKKKQNTKKRNIVQFLFYFVECDNFIFWLFSYWQRRI